VKVFAYDAIGNLLSQSGVGNYAYPLAGSALHSNRFGCAVKGNGRALPSGTIGSISGPAIAAAPLVPVNFSWTKARSCMKTSLSFLTA
jgi:hypothetical protein